MTDRQTHLRQIKHCYCCCPNQSTIGSCFLLPLTFASQMCSPLSSSVQATFAIYQHYCCRANQPDCLSPSADSLPILLYFKLARTHFKAGPLARSRGLSCNTKEFNLYAVQHGKHDSQLCLHWLPHSLSLFCFFSNTCQATRAKTKYVI